MSNTRLIFAGGGNAADSVAIDRVFADWSRGGRTLYLPIAMDGVKHSHASCLDWFRAAFDPLGLRDVEMWTDLESHRHEFLSRFASIYVGGGNTFRLLKLVRESGFYFALEEFVRLGGAVYGGSAGAILIGKSIATCVHVDVNDVGITDLRGLNFAHGRSIWCHYTEADDERIAAYRRATGKAIWAIPERAGIVVEGDQIRVLGTADAIEFDGRTSRTLVAESG